MEQKGNVVDDDDDDGGHEIDGLQVKVHPRELFEVIEAPIKDIIRYSYFCVFL